ncbi:MAG: LysR family transcriptional regulator [Gammaproteobacteria bacterium]|nr:LysR family transcriptional regulator [Gammaproteobacteria bacterium]
MDIVNLKAFLAVAEKGSFSLAGEQLHLCQPAVSKRIATIEAELETQLFDRIGKNITLTEAGKTLLPRAERILQEIDDSRRAISNLSDEVSGSLRIGTSHHIGLHRLPPVLRQYTEQYPHVKLDLRFMDSEQACRLVEKGELELGIVTLPAQPSDSIKTMKIWDDPLAVVVSKNHVLAKKKKTTLHDLSEHSAILPGSGTFTREIVQSAFEALGIKLNTTLSTNYLETIKMMVSIGLGWSVLPETMIDKDMRSLDIKQLKLKRTLGIVQHPNLTLSNAGKMFIQILGDV